MAMAKPVKSPGAGSSKGSFAGKSDDKPMLNPSLSTTSFSFDNTAAEAKLYRLLDTAYDRINDLKKVLMEEQQLTGVHSTEMDPIRDRQRNLLREIDQLQRQKQGQRRMGFKSLGFAALPKAKAEFGSASVSGGLGSATGGFPSPAETATIRAPPVPTLTISEIANRPNPKEAINKPVVPSMQTCRDQSNLSTVKRGPNPKDTLDRQAMPTMHTSRGQTNLEVAKSGPSPKDALNKPVMPTVQTPREQVSSDYPLDLRISARRSMGKQLQPDQKYNKRVSNFQFGLPSVTEVHSSKLQPVQAHLAPSNRSAVFSRGCLAPRMRLPSPSYNNHGQFMGNIQESPDKVVTEKDPDESFHSLNDSASGWSFHTANEEEEESLPDFTPDHSDPERTASALWSSMDDLSNRFKESLWELDRTSITVERTETTKPFEMSDFYKYSSKWNKLMNTTSSPIGLLEKRDRMMRRRSMLLESLTPKDTESAGNWYDGLQLPQPQNPDPPLPPRTFPRNANHGSRNARGTEAWVMDTPTIV